MAARIAVTAAASGIGLAIARAFAAQGAQVHVCDVDPDAVAAAGAEGLVAAEVDVADRRGARPLDRRGARGPGRPRRPREQRRHRRADGARRGRERRRVGALHCRGPHQPLPDVRAREPGDEGRRRGLIINISSTAGQYGIGMRSPYAAAKWAVIGLTKSLAVELGPYGVRVNAICPGSVDGDRMRGVIQREAAARGVVRGCRARVRRRPVDRALRAGRRDRRHVPLPRVGRGPHGERPSDRGRRSHRDVPPLGFVHGLPRSRAVRLRVADPPPRAGRAGTACGRAERGGRVRPHTRERVALRARREGPAPPASRAGGDVRGARRDALHVRRRAAGAP